MGHAFMQLETPGAECSDCGCKPGYTTFGNGAPHTGIHKDTPMSMRLHVNCLHCSTWQLKRPKHAAHSQTTGLSTRVNDTEELHEFVANISTNNGNVAGFYKYGAAPPTTFTPPGCAANTFLDHLLV